MYQGKTIFSQLMDFLSRHSFRQYVNRYQGNYRMRSSSCHDQFLCMAFAQLTFRESLRDIECCWVHAGGAAQAGIVRERCQGPKKVQ
jgi:hypothetical protein